MPTTIVITSPRPYRPPAAPAASSADGVSSPGAAPSAPADRFEPTREQLAIGGGETIEIADTDAMLRNRIRRALPELSEAHVHEVAQAWIGVATRPGFTAEMQEKPFEERLFGGIQHHFARPLRKMVGPAIQRWNALVEKLSPTEPSLRGLTLKYGKHQPGISIQQMLERIPRDA